MTSLLALAPLLLNPELSQSIRQLPALSTLLVEHYECRAALFTPAGDYKESYFQMAPTKNFGKATQQVTVGDDVMTANVSDQSLEILWTRNGEPFARGLTMVQKSLTKAYVLIVADPKNDESHADLSCSAVTYSDPVDTKGARK